MKGGSKAGNQEYVDEHPELRGIASSRHIDTVRGYNETIAAAPHCNDGTD